MVNGGFPLGYGDFRGRGNVLEGCEGNSAREADFAFGAK
jgi:hypothetical protein